MKLDLKTILIAGLTVVVIVLIMRDCSRPSEEWEAERKEQYDSAISELKARADRVQELQEHAIKSIAERRAKDSVVIKAKDERIATLIKQATKQRTPRVDTLILNNADLESFVNTQSEIIQEQRQEIDTLKASLEFHAKVNQDLIAQEFVEDRIEADMAIQTTMRIAELDKAAKKKGRGNKFWKGLSTVLAGAVLVEIVLLVAD